VPTTLRGVPVAPSNPSGSALVAMPLSHTELVALRDEYMCDDLELTDDMPKWTHAQAALFFSSGGFERPSAPDSPELLAASGSMDGEAVDDIAMESGFVSYLAALAAGQPEKALSEQGDALFALRRYQDALAAYNEVLKLDPTNMDIAYSVSLAQEAIGGGVWLRQLMPGRDFALAPGTAEEELIFGAAATMKNLVYLVGDAHSRECYAVDACWDTRGIAAFASRCKMKLVGSICTHGHFDHAGGSVTPELVALVYGPMARHRFDGHRVPGMREMAHEYGCELFCHHLERERIATQTGLLPAELTPLLQGSALPLGAAGTLEILHTPGHSTGSISICIQPVVGRTLAVLVGDTIFPGSCGRLDLSDSDKIAMYDTLHKLRQLEGTTAVYPGHSYAGVRTTIGNEKANGLLREFSKEQWFAMHT